MITKYSRRRAIKSAAATVALMGMPNLLESQAPLGTARGVPGRVVWVHDPKNSRDPGRRGMLRNRAQKNALSMTSERSNHPPCTRKKALRTFCKRYVL